MLPNYSSNPTIFNYMSINRTIAKLPKMCEMRSVIKLLQLCDKCIYAKVPNRIMYANVITILDHQKPSRSIQQSTISSYFHEVVYKTIKMLIYLSFIILWLTYSNCKTNHRYKPSLTHRTCLICMCTFRNSLFDRTLCTRLYKHVSDLFIPCFLHKLPTPPIIIVWVTSLFRVAEIPRFG